MLRLIFICWFLTFSLNTYANDLVNEVEDIKKMGRNFYSDVYESIDLSDKAIFRLSTETGISEEALSALVHDRDEYADEIKTYCDNPGRVIEVGKCKDNLILKYRNEEEMVTFERNLVEESMINSVWADGRIDNGFFDIVHDLNVIDVILFGEDATPFIFDYEKGKGVNENSISPGKSADGRENVSQPKIQEGGSTGQNNVINSLDQGWESVETKNAAYDDSLGNGASGSDDVNVPGVQGSKVEVSKSIGGKCLDPLKFVFKLPGESETREGQIGSNMLYDMELDGNQNTNTNFSVAASADGATSRLVDQNVLGISKDLFNNMFTGGNTKLSGFEPGSYPFVSFEPSQDSNRCRDSLYGDLVCLDKQKSKFSCSSNKIFCKDKSNVKIGTGRKDKECISCIINIANDIIRSELEGRVLYPRENSNKNGNIPNWLGPFGKPSDPIEFAYMPMAYYKEKDPKDFFEKLLKDRENEKISWLPPVKCVERSLIGSKGGVDDKTSQIEECNNVLANVRDAISKSDIQKARIRSNKKTYDEVTGRLREFRELTERGIEENIRNFPFDVWDEMPKCADIH